MEHKKHIFSEVEKNIFIDILKRYTHIVGNKKTDGHSLQQKNIAWNRIAYEYNSNSQASHQATSKQLRRLWMNLKQRQREKFNLKRQHRMSSGGEPSTSDAVIDPGLSHVTQDQLVSVNDAIASDTVSEMVVIEKIEKMSPIDPLFNSSSANEGIPEVPTIPSIQTPQFSSIPKSTPTNPVREPSISNIWNKRNILQNEYINRKRRADELHILEVELMEYRLRKAKAEAELAELILEKNRFSVYPG